MSAENIGFPVFYSNYILYNSSYDGIDNIKQKIKSWYEERGSFWI